MKRGENLSRRTGRKRKAVNDGKSKQMFHRLQNERWNTDTQP